MVCPVHLKFERRIGVALCVSNLSSLLELRREVSFKNFLATIFRLSVGWFIFKRLSVERYFARWSLGYEVEEIRNPGDIRRRVNEARYVDVHEERQTAEGVIPYLTSRTGSDILYRAGNWHLVPFLLVVLLSG